MYIGVRHDRVKGKEYDEFIEEFMLACTQRYTTRVLLQVGAGIYLKQGHRVLALATIGKFPSSISREIRLLNGSRKRFWFLTLFGQTCVFGPCSSIIFLLILVFAEIPCDICCLSVSKVLLPAGTIHRSSSFLQFLFLATFTF